MILWLSVIKQQKLTESQSQYLRNSKNSELIYIKQWEIIESSGSQTWGYKFQKSRSQTLIDMSEMYILSRTTGDFIAVPQLEKY